MIFGLDYDGTYDRAPDLWNVFITTAKRMGHKVYIVTMRYHDVPSESIQQELVDKVDGVYYTARQAKQVYMTKKGIKIDVWIDDRPYWLLNDAGDRILPEKTIPSKPAVLLSTEEVGWLMEGSNAAISDRESPEPTSKCPYEKNTPEFEAWWHGYCTEVQQHEKDGM